MVWWSSVESGQIKSDGPGVHPASASYQLYGRGLLTYPLCALDFLPLK